MSHYKCRQYIFETDAELLYHFGTLTLNACIDIVETENVYLYRVMPYGMQRFTFDPDLDEWVWGRVRTTIETKQFKHLRKTIVDGRMKNRRTANAN